MVHTPADAANATANAPIATVFRIRRFDMAPCHPSGNTRSAQEMQHGPKHHRRERSRDHVVHHHAQAAV